jgi:hypothetical protein
MQRRSQKESLTTIVGKKAPLGKVRGKSQMLLEMTGIDRMFQIYSSQEEFLKKHQVWRCALKGYIK